MSDLEALPSLRAFCAFCAAGRQLSFRLAAESLGVTQGAVAQHVRGLEGDLGARLFERGARGLTFPEAGRAYYRRIEAALPGIDPVVLAADTPALPGPAAEVTLIEGEPPFGAGIAALLLAPVDLIARRWRDGDAVLLQAPGTDWGAFLKTDVPPSGPCLASGLAAIDAALAGDGAALVPQYLVAPELQRGRLVQPVTARLGTERNL